jgi:inhibitor of KinA sporulation pathway (predicted exonuclease)
VTLRYARSFLFGEYVLNYIIFDLEWNNAYSHALNKPMNEIIEIGALKLDEKLNIVDSYKQLIKPQLTKKLSSRCKNLTNITNEEISQNGTSFESAINDFSMWSRGQNNVFMSWSNSDLYVLSSNFLRFLGDCKVNFMPNYCDAQKYCMSFIPRGENESNNQIGLSKCAEILGIDFDSSKLHRALADCYLTAECLKAVFDKNALSKFIQPCDNTFFERLIYKPYMICEPVCDLFNINDVELLCPNCNSSLKKITNIELRNKSFCFATRCTKCKKSYWTYVRAKKTYDDVVVSKRLVLMNKKRARRIN